MNRDDAFTLIKLAFITGMAAGLSLAYMIARRIEDRNSGMLFGTDKKCPCCTGRIVPTDKRCSSCYVELEGR